MKKIIVFLTSLVLILSGFLVYTFTTSNKHIENVSTAEKIINSNENLDSATDEIFRFKDIEKMEKANSLDEAFDKIFGKDRLVEYKSTYVQNSSYPSSVYLDIIIDPQSYIQMEMIDFLHYLKYSNLISNDSIKNQVKKYTFLEGTGEFYSINMYAYQAIKPGMNIPDADFNWSINTDQLEQIDFSDKETLLNEITSYGKWSF